MGEIRAAYDPMEHAAAALTAAAGEVSTLVPLMAGPAGTDAGDAAVNEGIAKVAQDLRGRLATTADLLRSTGDLVAAARRAYDGTDRSLLPATLVTPATAATPTAPAVLAGGRAR